MCYRRPVGEGQCRVGARINDSATTSATERACTGSTGAKGDLLKQIEHIVPECVWVLESTILRPFEQEVCTVLAIDQGKWTGSIACIGDHCVQHILIDIHLGNAGAILRDRDERRRSTPAEHANSAVGVDGEVAIMCLLKGLVQIKAELVFVVVAVTLGS